MKTMTFMTFLVVSLSLSGDVFAFTGGLNYYLRAFNNNLHCEAPNCESHLTTTVQLQSVVTSPPAESPGISTPASFDVPSNGILADFSIGRIEYPVSFLGSADYLTDILRSRLFSSKC